jgi:hypothetical protein
MKVRIGNIVEIQTSKGLAYAQYSHKHDKPPKYGALLRVFDQIFQEQPADLEGLTRLPIQFSIFFPLQTAVNQNIVKIVGNITVPENLRSFPLFRSGTPDRETKKVATWWLWDGEREWRVGELTPEQRKLPIEGVWNDTMLIRRIESGWRPENDSR